MKFVISMVLMCILVVGVASINYNLSYLFDISSKAMIVQHFWFLYCVVSGALVGWFGADRIFSSHFKV